MLGLAPVAQIIFSTLNNRNVGVVEVSRLALYQVDVTIPAAGAETFRRRELPWPADRPTRHGAD